MSGHAGAWDLIEAGQARARREVRGGLMQADAGIYFSAHLSGGAVLVFERAVCGSTRRSAWMHERRVSPSGVGFPGCGGDFDWSKLRKVERRFLSYGHRTPEAAVVALARDTAKRARHMRREALAAEEKANACAAGLREWCR